MKRLLLSAVAFAVLLPAAAFAQIRNSAHDMSSSSTAAVKSDTNQICIYCHAPHNAQSTQLLWNHVTSAAVLSWGNDLDGTPMSATTEGTPLPAALQNTSRRCLSCHDGTVALGNVTAPGLGQADPVFAALAGRVTAGGMMEAASPAAVGTNGNMQGHHPVSIPYAGQTYEGVASGVPATRVGAAVPGGYYSIQTGVACTSPTGVCTVGTGGGSINLLPTATGGTTDVGIECTSCHEPHNKSNIAHMLVLDNAASALCLACHNK